jgi:predicted RNA-binding Zn ribbon-like protein
MDEHDKRRVGEQVEPGGRPKAPGRLELLQRFVNSHNHDLPADWDRLGTAERAAAWLAEKGLIAPGQPVTEAEAARLRQLREAIRALAVANQAGEPRPAVAAELRDATADLRLRVTIDDSGGAVLAPDRPGVQGAAATLLGILLEAQLAGQWERLKGCRQCGYAFYDRSKNRSAAWCSMSICGNRSKNRAYYRRRASAPG